MNAGMHHRKRGGLIPWTGFIRYPGLAEFRIGTVHTAGHDAFEARKLLEALAATALPPGFAIGHIERGALIYRPHQE